MIRLAGAAVALALATSPVAAQTIPTAAEAPIVIGTRYDLPSAVMGQTREINVWLPPGYHRGETRYSVLYVLDGGVEQDFHHISGLAQLGTVNGTTRDVIVVGVASMDRRNELALPTADPELIARYPTQGQSERFRRFLIQEVAPFIEARFRTDGQSTLMGESLAGLFVVETFLKSPESFDAYVAVSPSLWWDGGALAASAEHLLAGHPPGARRLILTLGNEGPEMERPMGALVEALTDGAGPELQWSYTPRPAESHATIYHGAALDAFRSLYAYPEE